MFVEDLKKSFLQSLVWIGPEVSEEVIQMWSVNNGDGGNGLQVNNGDHGDGLQVNNGDHGDELQVNNGDRGDGLQIQSNRGDPNVKC